MASRNNSSGNGGCLGVLIALAIVVAAIAWSLSTVGHLLGLTPSYSEAFDRPDGWVTRHYEGVAAGYALTALAIATAVALAWLAWLSATRHGEGAQRARQALRWAQGTALVLGIAIVVLPIGQRQGVATATGEVGSALEGNVPDLIGMKASAASDALDALGLDVTYEARPADGERCRVVAQEPSAGGEVEEYGDVRLRCEVRVPDVVGRKAETAQDRLYDADLEVRLVNEPADLRLDRCRVRRQSRSGTTIPGATVRLTLRCTKPKARAATPKRSQAPDCDPNYTGACLKPDSPDYDCAGGSGNGPDYTGPVTVVGVDHYELNSDPENDSLGCEG